MSGCPAEFRRIRARVARMSINELKIAKTELDGIMVRWQQRWNSFQGEFLEVIPDKKIEQDKSESE